MFAEPACAPSRMFAGALSKVSDRDCCGSRKPGRTETGMATGTDRLRCISARRLAKVNFGFRLARVVRLFDPPAP